MRCELIICPPAAPATPTLKKLSNALDSVMDWHLLGVKLGIKAHELEAIEKNYHGDIVRCKHEMLGRWLQNAKLPTWKAVADALCWMGKHAIALKIRKQHCISSTATGMCLMVYVIAWFAVVLEINSRK